MQSSQRRVRYGIIGFGLFAERAIAPAIVASPNSTLVAIQKRSLALAKEKAKQFAIPLAFDSVEELAAHPDVGAVFIVSANAFHCKETLAAARAGKHVLVEKPIAMNAGEARRMIAACKRAKVKLMVGHMLRLSPLVRRMRDIVRSGMIGEVVAVKSEFIYDARVSQRQWLFDRKLAGGGPVFDIGVHSLDTIRYVLDDEVVATTGALHPVPTKTRTEGSAMLSLRFSRGVVASIYCSFIAPLRRTFIEFIGTEGIISANDFTFNEASVYLKITMGKNGKEESAKTETIAIPNLYTEEVSLFSRSILENTAAPIPGDVGLKNQIVLDAAMKK